MNEKPDYSSANCYTFLQKLQVEHHNTSNCKHDLQIKALRGKSWGSGGPPCEIPAVEPPHPPQLGLLGSPTFAWVLAPYPPGELGIT